MAVNEPIDPRVRLAISQWPDDAPRGAVSAFCVEHDISRKSFYELRKRVKADGPAAVLEPRTRRPKSSPWKLSDEVKARAVAVRAALEASGLDHGPISVHDKMGAMGLDPVPSVASLARIFREAGVARLEPKKKPRSAWRRFVYPAPNACWQLDATEYVLTGGRTCVIFQLIDDHSRYALASHAAWAETAQAAITGKPYKPTTQGKNERFHQTLFRYLDKQPIAQSLDELQAQVDAFDHLYNHERPHQGLPGRVTPRTAWEATAKAAAPRPKPDLPWLLPLAPKPKRPAPQQQDLPAGTRIMTLSTAGTITLAGVTYKVDGQLACEQVLVVTDAETIIVADLDGEVLIEHTRPAPGVKYVGNGKPRGQRPTADKPSPKS